MLSATVCSSPAHTQAKFNPNIIGAKYLTLLANHKARNL